MISLKKPIIVHNGFLDLMHVQFLRHRSTIDSSKIYQIIGVNTNRKYTVYFLQFTITNIFSVTHHT